MRSLSSQLRGRLWIANTYWTESVMKSKAARPRMDVDLEELDGIIDGALRAPLRADATIYSHRSNRIVPGWQSRVSLEGETADLLRIG